MSNYRVILMTVIAVTILCHSHTYAGPVRSLASVVAARSAQSKIPRSIRTPFRNTEMMTARGFGKRSQQLNQLNDDLDKPWNFQKHENAFVEDSLLNDVIDSNGPISDSFPYGSYQWFLHEMAVNPIFFRTIVQRYGQILANEPSASAANSPLNEFY